MLNDGPSAAVLFRRTHTHTHTHTHLLSINQNLILRSFSAARLLKEEKEKEQKDEAKDETQEEGDKEESKEEIEKKKRTFCSLLDRIKKAI